MTNKETKIFFTAAAAVQVALFSSQRRLKQDLDLVVSEPKIVGEYLRLEVVRSSIIFRMFPR
jgi:hypothetical protein